MSIVMSNTQRSSPIDRVLNHSFLSVIGILVTGATFGGVVATAKNDREVNARDARIEALEADLNSLEPTLSADGDEIDVNGLIIDESDRDELSPSKYEPIGDDDLYAGTALEGRGWSYTSPSALDVLNEAGGPAAVGLDAEEAEVLDSFGLHMWSLQNEIEVEAQPDRVQKFSTRVTVERAPMDKIVNAFRDKIERVPEAADVLKGIEELASRSPIAAMMQSHVYLRLNATSSTLVPVIEEVRMAGNVAHYQTTNIFRNVIVDDEQVDRYFVRESVTYYECGSDIVIMTTYVPSADEQSNDVGAVNSLLGLLHIVC